MTGEQSTSESAGKVDPRVEQAVQKFIVARRSHSLYPSNNPNVRASAGKVCEALAAIAGREPLELTIDRDGIHNDGHPVLAGVDEVAQVAQRLYLANIAGLAFEADTDANDILAMLDELKQQEADPHQSVSIDERLRHRGVSRVQVHQAGQVKVELQSDTDSAAWDEDSLKRLEELEKEVFGSGQKGVREAFHVVAAGQDAKSARLTSMLRRPVEFATLLLEVASLERVEGKVNLDHQFSVLLRLVAELEPLLETLPAADRLTLYGKLEQVVTTLQRSIQREVLDVSLPPYVRLGSVERLFPDRIRMLTVKEALSLGLGAGLMPFLMGALRRIAAGDPNLPAFLAGTEAPPLPPNVEALASYRPIPLAPAPPVRPRLGPPFFEPAPGGAPHPGELALGRAVASANGSFDSIGVICDLLLQEQDPGAYGQLVGHLKDRFSVCLAARNLGLAEGVLLFLGAEKARHASGAPELLAAVEAALEQCAGREGIQDYVEAISTLTAGSPELDLAIRPLELLGGAVVESLLDILVDEPSKSNRRRLLDLLARLGPQHIDRIAGRSGHELWYVVRNVIAVLGQLGAPGLERIRAIPRHPEPRVRREVVRVLGHDRNEASTAIVLGALRDDDDAVVREAINRLVATGTRAAVPVLQELLAKPGFYDREHQTVTAVAKGLGALGGAQVATLLDRLGTGAEASGWLRSPEVRKVFVDAAAAIRARVAEAKP